MFAFDFIFKTHNSILDDKSKHLFNNIHGLLESKVLLKHLYNNGVQYLLDSKLKQQAFEAAANGNYLKNFSFIFFLNMSSQLF